ncbi:MAG: hypothetical protein GY814_12700 [Gammaproteobacteria bacterium]|nr:hypothetical protein [Gammaproteobacteria bacterium]
MNNAYIHCSENGDKGRELTGYIEKIFENHYFSNHWEFAESLEHKLNGITGRKHNITYMNSSVALISMLYILGLRKHEHVFVSRGVSLFPWVQSCIGYIGLNCSLIDDSTECKSSDILISLDVDLVDEMKSAEQVSGKIIIPLELRNKNQKYADCAHIYDMGLETCFGLSTGAFVAVNNDDHADKLRWMRSSYARTGDVSIYINGNGRFSEIQAAEALVAIKNNEFKGNVFSEINQEMMASVATSTHQMDYTGSEYTAGILRIFNPDRKILTALHSLSIERGLLYDAPQDGNKLVYALIRVPVDAAVRGVLLSVLSQRI